MSDTERETETETETETQAEREAGTEPKADAQLLSHPGDPRDG